MTFASQGAFKETEVFNSNIQDWDTSSATSFYVRGLPLTPLTLPTAHLDTPAHPSSRGKRARTGFDYMTFAWQGIFKNAEAFNSNIQNWDTSSSMTFAVCLPLTPLTFPPHAMIRPRDPTLIN